MSGGSTDAHVRSDPARIAAGWTRRFVADRHRVEEIARLYRSLGFEVATDPVRPEQLSDGCRDCRVLVQLGYCTIYTRKPPRQDGGPG